MGWRGRKLSRSVILPSQELKGPVLFHRIQFPQVFIIQRLSDSIVPMLRAIYTETVLLINGYFELRTGILDIRYFGNNCLLSPVSKFVPGPLALGT